MHLFFLTSTKDQLFASESSTFAAFFFLFLRKTLLNVNCEAKSAHNYAVASPFDHIWFETAFFSK